ncbi:MAG: type II toxin-antitoxin system HicB family antitoxin [Phycisphaerales bacterium]|nr:type II toxin-antitoxin system HicB family antitoxin [Phycisphaerales bacterium]
MRYQIILRAEPEGGYTVMVPALPGCITWGKTIRQAKRMVRDAISGYLVSLAKHGEPIPDDDDLLTASVDVPVDPEALHV